MQVKLDKPLSFIREKDLLDFVIVHRNGANLIVAGQYSQNVKKNELDEIMRHNTLKANQAPQETPVKKTSKELFAEAKAAKKQEDDEAESKAKAEELITASSGDGKPSEKL